MTLKNFISIHLFYPPYLLTIQFRAAGVGAWNLCCVSFIGRQAHLSTCSQLTITNYSKSFEGLLEPCNFWNNDYLFYNDCTLNRTLM